MIRRKKKTTRIDKRKRHGKADPVRVQVAVKVANVPGAEKFVTNAFMNRVVRNFVETGHTPKGIKVDAIRWKNPVRSSRALARWKSSDDSDQSMSGARRTLRRLLHRLRFNFIRVRKSKRVR